VTLYGTDGRKHNSQIGCLLIEPKNWISLFWPTSRDIETIRKHFERMNIETRSSDGSISARAGENFSNACTAKLSLGFPQVSAGKLKTRVPGDTRTISAHLS
jgi:hypothetical protein